MAQRLSRKCPLTLALLVFSLFTSPADAQQGPFVVKYKKIAPKLPPSTSWHSPATQRSLVGGPWMIGPDMKATVTIKNIVELAPISVTPIVYLSNGRRFTLPDVAIEPSGTTVIDIGQALQEHWRISSWATLSGYMEVQYWWPWDGLCATINDVDSANSLAFSFVLKPLRQALVSENTNTQIASSAVAEIGSSEGVWWKQEENVMPVVSLSNVSAKQAAVILETLDSKGSLVRERSLTLIPHETKLIQLSEVHTLADTVGGVTVRYPENRGGVFVSGRLEDKVVGYSAHIPFYPSPDPQQKPSLRSYAEVGLMFGAADPMMRFPNGTVFTPYSVLRNVANRAVQVTPYLYWMQGAAAHSAQLESFEIAPGSSVSIDTKALVTQAGLNHFNGDLTLSFDANTVRGSLLLASGSVDHKNTYVFETIPSQITEGIGSTLSYWDVGNGDDTMVTVWNPSAEAEDLAFKLFYSGGHYVFPIHLESRAMSTFNVSDILKSQSPDSEDNIIPPSVTNGSATISGARSEVEHIFVNSDAGVYNVKKATCVWHCNNCSGATSAWIVDDPFAVPVNQNHQLQFKVQVDHGNVYDDTANSNWSSSNNGIASVSSGMVTGVSAGAVTIRASDSGYPLNGKVCGDPPEDCNSYGIQSPDTGAIGPYQAEPIAIASQGPVGAGFCPNSQYPGYVKYTTNQLQHRDGTPVAVSGISVSDTITLQGRNDLGISGTVTGSDKTTGDGSWSDQYSVCTPACPGNQGETDAFQSWTINGFFQLPHLNGIVYKCTSISVDGH